MKLDGVIRCSAWPAIVVAAACAAPTPSPPEPPTAAPSGAPVVVAEAFVAELPAGDVVDSLAVDTTRSRVLATAKGADQIVVLDAATGRELERVGGPGDGAGRFRRPNGIAVAGDLALVVERDNARVQVLSLPELEAVGAFGGEVLNRPYGLAVLEQPDGDLTVWVTDSVELSDEELTSPPGEVQRVERFRVRATPSGVDAEHLGTFGDADGPGALWMVESIGIDPVRDRLLVSDEHVLRRHLKVYTAAGEFTGRILGADLFEAEPEGLALWPCGDGGWWIAADQRAGRTVFVLFERDSLQPAGSFQGEATAATDGISLTTSRIGDFARGALYAVDDDRAVAAFDLGAVADALGLACPSGPESDGG